MSYSCTERTLRPHVDHDAYRNNARDRRIHAYRRIIYVVKEFSYGANSKLYYCGLSKIFLD